VGGEPEVRDASIAGNKKAQRLIRRLRKSMPEKAGGGGGSLPASYWDEKE
jgi:hypothetical protein